MNILFIHQNFPGQFKFLVGDKQNRQINDHGACLFCGRMQVGYNKGADRLRAMISRLPGLFGIIPPFICIFEGHHVFQINDHC